MPYLSALELWSRQGAIQIHVYLHLYLWCEVSVWTGCRWVWVAWHSFRGFFNSFICAWHRAASAPSYQSVFQGLHPRSCDQTDHWSQYRQTLQDGIPKSGVHYPKPGVTRLPKLPSSIAVSYSRSQTLVGQVSDFLPGAVTSQPQGGTDQLCLDLQCVVRA